MEKSLQETYAPRNACFGCGPMNEKGLRIRSFAQGAEVIAVWTPQPHHEAFPGILNGGIIGALLDCHMNWTAIWHLMQTARTNHPPCMVTADYSVKLLRPTPTDGPLQLSASVVEVREERVRVEAKLIAHDKVCVTASGTFVAVKPEHPAYHHW